MRNTSYQWINKQHISSHWRVVNPAWSLKTPLYPTLPPIAFQRETENDWAPSKLFAFHLVFPKPNGKGQLAENELEQFREQKIKMQIMLLWRYTYHLALLHINWATHFICELPGSYSEKGKDDQWDDLHSPSREISSSVQLLSKSRFLGL